MLSRSNLNRIIIFGFLVLVGFCLAKAISKQSTLGIILALVSLAAVITFLCIAAKAKADFEAAKREKEIYR